MTQLYPYTTLPILHTRKRLPQNGFVQTGLWEAPKSISKIPAQVNSPWPDPQVLIALCSPIALLETGLRMRLPEKSRILTLFGAEQSVLHSPVCLGIIAKYGHCSRVSAQSERNFSAVQTAWRRGGDSITAVTVSHWPHYNKAIIGPIHAGLQAICFLG
jgi:hypothetical protein